MGTGNLWTVLMFDINQMFRKEILGFLVVSFVFSFFRKYKSILFLEFLLNLFFVYFIFLKSDNLGLYPLGFLTLVSLLIFLFSLKAATRWLAYTIPTLVLVSSRLLPSVEMSDLAVYGGSWAPVLVAHTGLMSVIPLVGLSYIAFRWYRFLLDTRTSEPSMLSFFTYCFYVPIFYIGPITSYSEFSKSIDDGYRRTSKVFLVAGLRILWGAVKFYPLASLFFQLTFSRFMMSEVQSIGLGQFLVACAVYPAYLFLNFSGFIDIVIGVSALLGFNIDKNFERPYLASNVGDFWRRWHISLTELLKDLIHVPLLKALGRYGVKSDLAKYSLGVFFVFTVMAYWHGNTVSFYIFSMIQVVALVIQRSVRKGKTITATPFCRGVKIFLIWGYLAFSFFFFENSWSQIQLIFSKLLFW